MDLVAVVVAVELVKNWLTDGPVNKWLGRMLAALLSTSCPCTYSWGRASYSQIHGLDQLFH